MNIQLKHLCFILICLFISLPSCKVKQNISTSDSQAIKINYFIEGENLSSLNLDKLGNIFVVKNNRILQKFKPNGELDKTYDAQSTGFIHSIDISNPLYILIYYRDAFKIHLLDRNLALLNEIDIMKWTQNDITAAALSNDNRIWLYDNNERKLKKFSVNGKIITESLDLYGITELNTRVEQMTENSNSVFMRNIDSKIIILDNLARYKSDKDYEIGLAMQFNNSQLCGPIGDKYTCIRLDDNRFQQLIEIEKLHSDHLESLLFKYELYQLLSGGIIKDSILR